MARAMKDSGIEWCKSIPVGWQVMRLKYVMDNYDSQRIPIDAGKRNQEGDILYDYYGASGVIDQIAGYTHVGRRILIGEDGANLVLRNLPLVYIADGKYWVNNHAHILAPKHGWSLDYFAHQMECIDYFKYITGSAQPKLSQSNLNSVNLIVPPLQDQELIATYLNAKCGEIDALMADVQAQIETLEQYKRSVITEAVTKGLNPNVPMKDSGTAWIDTMPSHWALIPAKYMFHNSDLRRIGDDVLLTSSQKYGIISQTDYMERENAKIVLANQGIEDWKHVEPYDFVISLRSFQGGLEMSEITGCITWHYVVLKASRAIVPKYYKWLFKSQLYITALQRTCNFIRDGQDLRFSNFSKVPLPEPPIEEQQAIASYLETKCAEIDAIIDGKRQQLAVLEEYKKSIIFEYVTGKKEVPTNA